MYSDWLNLQIKKEIGLTDVLDKLTIICPYGFTKKTNIQPYSYDEVEDLVRELDNVSVIREVILNTPQISNSIIRLLKEIKDIRGSLERTARDEILNEVELFEIKNQLMLMAELMKILNREKSLKDIDKIKQQNVDNIIAILDPEVTGMRTFYIYDKYSTLLTEIREKIANIEKQMWIIKKKNKRVLEKDLESQTKEYIDLDLKNLNLELESLKMKEEEEELRIRQWLSSEIKSNKPAILKNIGAIGELDFIIGKARLAIETNSVKPTIAENVNVSFIEGRHIPLESHLKTNNMKYTPINVNIEKGVTVITGANMGGKTISLKLVGLIVAMAQLGFHVPAKEAKVGLFDFIYFSSGDQQSIQSGLSTFGGEIYGLSRVLSKREKSGLLLIDELARGTNPIEGYGISKGIITYLKKSQFTSLITTHLDGLNIIEDVKHLQVVGLKNLDIDKLKSDLINKDGKRQILEKYMDYRLEEIKEGTEVPKDAILVAELMGLNEEILNIARKSVENLVDRRSKLE